MGQLRLWIEQNSTDGHCVVSCIVLFPSGTVEGPNSGQWGAKRVEGEVL